MFLLRARGPFRPPVRPSAGASTSYCCQKEFLSSAGVTSRVRKDEKISALFHVVHSSLKEKNHILYSKKGKYIQKVRENIERSPLLPRPFPAPGGNRYSLLLIHLHFSRVQTIIWNI